MTTVLIVDDDEVITMLFQMILESAGYRVVKARSGAEAIQQLDSGTQVDLVVSDVMMKDMNGLELLGELHESLLWGHLPVILCTASKDADNVKRAARLGCRHFLLKPVDRSLLLQRVSEALAGCSIELRDRKEIMKRHGFDAVMYSSLMGKFSDELARALSDWDHATSGTVAAVDSATLSNLCEAAVVLGAERLAGIMQGARHRALEGTLDLGDCRVLRRECQRLLDLIKT